MSTPEPLARLIARFATLPGVGAKSARRMVYHLLGNSPEELGEWGEMVATLRERVVPCPVCHAWTDREVCPLCSDVRRDDKVICVVEKASDIEPFEKSGVYRGLYHVLGGQISPLDGIGPDDLQIASLLSRLDGVREVILATGASAEGEATSLYLERLIGGRGVAVTRLARGIPVGADLEYLDVQTLARAFQARGAS